MPPDPVYELGSPRSEPIEEAPEDPRPGPPREEGPGAPNIYTDSARARVRGRGRGIPVIPVQHVAPFCRGSGNRRNFLGRVMPM